MATKGNGRRAPAETPLSATVLGGGAHGNISPEALELEQLDQTIEALRAELGEGESDLKVKVSRLEGKEAVYCAAYRLDELETDSGFLDRIRDEWGPGRYRIFLHDGIAMRLNRVRPIAARPTPVAPPVDSGLAAQLAELQRQVATMAQAIANPRDGEAQWLERMKTYREIFGAPAAAQAPSPARQIQELLQVIDGAKAIRDSYPPGDAGPHEPSVYELGSQVLKIIEASMSNRQAPAAPMVALPSVAVPEQIAPIAPAVDAPGAAANDPAAAMLHEAIGVLNGLARMGAAHDVAADLVFNQATDEVLQWLEAPDWWPRIAALAPSVAPFEPWYRGLHVELMSLWTKEKQRQAGGNATPKPATP